MIHGLTTGQCEGVLNELRGMRCYHRGFILGQIKDGLLIARVYHEGGTRSRAYIRIHPDDFRAYVHKHHADLLADFDARMAMFHMEQRISDIAS